MLTKSQLSVAAVTVVAASAAAASDNPERMYGRGNVVGRRVVPPYERRE